MEALNLNHWTSRKVLIISFDFQKHIGWLDPICLFLLLFLLPWETDQRKYAIIYLRQCFAMFSSRNFMVSCFMFKPLCHFEFIFMYYGRECSTFIELHVLSSFINTNSWSDYLFSVLYTCLLYWRLTDCHCISGLLFQFIDLCVFFGANTTVWFFFFNLLYWNIVVTMLCSFLLYSTVISFSIYILFHILFYYYLPQDIVYSFLCH